jgi:hypothetical protein
MADPILPPTVIIDQNRGYRMWHISELYFPDGTGNGAYVPNVNDMVLDWNQGFFRVTAVDYTTGESTLSKWNPPAESEAVSDQDILLGAGPGRQAESFRAYLDVSVMPHRLALDSRLHIYGSNAKYYKVFKGTDLSPAGEIISAFYNASGTFLGENVPLELVVMPDATNVAVKTPAVGYTLRSLSDGEVVTVVVYDDAGNVSSSAKLLVKNTAYMRTTDASLKYVTAIRLKTPFLSKSDPKLIEYPINMPVQNLNLMGEVQYSDGSKLEMPVDGTKFSVYGLDNFVASIQGQTLPVVLTYKLSAGEYAYINEPSPDKHIAENYRATTLKADGAYSVKLYSYPVWQDQINGYRLEHFLYNLNREEVYNVTGLVQLASGSPAFNPTDYGVNQKLTLAINLNQVNPKFSAFRHTQTIDISLLTEGTLNGQDNWTIGFSPGQTPRYGVGLEAIATFVDVTNWRLDLTCGCTTKAEWLEKVYAATQPLIDPSSEAIAPEPNFFVLVSGNQRIELPIDQWGTLVTVTAAPAEGKNVYIEFLRRGQVTDWQLSKAALVVHHAGT